MNNNLNDSLVLTLAERLMQRHVDAKTITESLELLVKNSGFDGAAIYEIDQLSTFHRKESYNTKDYLAPLSISLKQLHENKLHRIEQNTLFKVQTGHGTNESEKYLLELFDVSSLLIFSIADEKTYVHGFIIFYSLNDLFNLNAKEEHLLQVLLNMFAQYIDTRMFQNRLDFTQTSFESIIDNTGIDIYVNDFVTHDILYVNESMAAPYGGKSSFASHKCWEVLFPGQDGPCEFCPQTKIIDEEGNPSKVYTWDYQRAFDGSWFRVFSSAFRWTDGRLAHVVSSADITDNKNYEALIEYMANYDSLTNLPNRRKLIEDCEALMQDESNKSWYLLFFDIDGFKKINDCFGHSAGDEFLVQLSKFLSDIPLIKDLVYRNGGDEFVAIVKNVHEPYVRNLANYILERFKKPWDLEKGSIQCGASIGGAEFPIDGRNAEELIRCADHAMYSAKNDGGSSFNIYKNQ